MYQRDALDQSIIRVWTLMETITLREYLNQRVGFLDCGLLNYKILLQHPQQIPDIEKYTLDALLKLQDMNYVLLSYNFNMNIAFIAFMVPLGLSAAIRSPCSCPCGNPGDHGRLVIGMRMRGLVVLLVRNLWGLAYSNSEGVTKYTARITPILSVSIFLDGLQDVLSGKQENILILQ
ncbi:hypothetical protein BAE44_0021598 [Dichanthelium oligosanthes]|uniref:Uncharacterized protein n=1 Tax=Dichanthelium oligosanthes TaxID=888268 RepID=A0A1E5UWX8_9POAL|nr:hypothetical protein BAE44_0021598 [Dichanthelium oligosanthes]